VEEFKAYRIHQDGKSVHARFEDRKLTHDYGKETFRLIHKAGK